MQLYDINEFRATKNWPYAVCAGCVIYRTTAQGVAEVLLLKREAENDRTVEDFITYHLPKGHNNVNETLMQTAVREALEETGSKVDIQTYLGALTKEYTYKNNFCSRTFHYFAAKWQADVQAMDSEHDERLWAPINQAEKMLGAPNPKGEDELIRRFKTFMELTA